MVSAGPAPVKHHCALISTPPLLVVNDRFCWIFREVRSAQQAQMARFGQTSIGSPECSVHSASSHTTPAQAAPRVPLLQRRIPNLLSDQTPAPGSALHPPQHPHRHQPPTYRVQLPLRGLPSGQTQARGLPLLLLEQSAAVHSPPPVVSARARLHVVVGSRTWSGRVAQSPSVRPIVPLILDDAQHSFRILECQVLPTAP